MAEKRKPEYDIVLRAVRLMKDPGLATKAGIRRLASRILNDEKNAPRPNLTVPKLAGRPG